MGRPYKDLSKLTFGCLTVLRIYSKGGAGRHTSWLCLCSCGTNVVVESNNLLRGHTKSCGHLVASTLSERTKKYNKYLLTEDVGIGYTENGYEFLFDLDDYESIRRFCWTYDSGYICSHDVKNNSKKIRLHRLVTNASDTDLVDHEDRNPLNCQKENLRFSTKAENARNHKIAKNNTSGIIGVHRAENDKWRVSCAGKIYGKRYTDFEMAVRARLTLEKEFYGENYSPQRHLFSLYGVI